MGNETTEFLKDNPLMISFFSFVNGIFNVMLGNFESITASFFEDNPTAFLGIKVGTDSEMSPRQQITSVAYTFTAGNGIPRGGNTSSSLSSQQSLLPPYYARISFYYEAVKRQQSANSGQQHAFIAPLPLREIVRGDFI